MSYTSFSATASGLLYSGECINLSFLLRCFLTRFPVLYVQVVWTPMLLPPTPLPKGCFVLADAATMLSIVSVAFPVAESQRLKGISVFFFCAQGLHERVVSSIDGNRADP